MQKVKTALLGLIFATSFVSAIPAGAQTNSYKQTNLSSDTAGAANHTSPNLVNPWGVAFVPGSPFWIADNNSGHTTLYDKTGALSGDFLIPPPLGSTNASTPTGIVANTHGGFKVDGFSSMFIFDTEDGTIAGWYPTIPEAIIARDFSGLGAVYKGLALVTNNGADFLLAANFNSGAVEAYDTNFSPIGLPGTFTDPTLPAGFAAFGIHVIGNNQVVVTYAQQDDAKHDPVHAAGAGYVSLFDTEGNFIRRIASQGTLNAPWGATVAPATFGVFQGALLIGNFGDGTINAFDLNSGNFLGQLQDANGAVIANASLWELVFDPSGQTGDPNTLYITAGLNNEQGGLFAAITPSASQPPGADFRIVAAPMNLTVAAGQPASFQVSVTGLNGFDSAVTFGCSGQPANTSCSFSPNSVTPQSGGTASTTLTLTTSSAPYTPPMSMRASGLWLPLSGFGLFGLVALESRRRRLRIGARGRWLGFAFGLICMLAVAAGISGCGGYSGSNTGGTPRGTTNLTITASSASGAITHSTSVSLTVQ